MGSPSGNVKKSITSIIDNSEIIEDSAAQTIHIAPREGITYDPMPPITLTSDIVANPYTGETVTKQLPSYFPSMPLPQHMYPSQYMPSFKPILGPEPTEEEAKRGKELAEQMFYVNAIRFDAKKTYNKNIDLSLPFYMRQTSSGKYGLPGSKGIYTTQDHLYEGLNKHDRARVRHILSGGDPLQVDVPFSEHGGKSAAAGFKAVWKEIAGRTEGAAWGTQNIVVPMQESESHRAVVDNHKVRAQESVDFITQDQTNKNLGFWSRIKRALEQQMAAQELKSSVEVIGTDLVTMAGSHNIDQYKKDRLQFIAEGDSEWTATHKAYKKNQANFGAPYTTTLEFIQPVDLLAEFVVPGGILRKPLIAAAKASNAANKTNKLSITAYTAWKNNSFSKINRQNYLDMLTDKGFSPDAINRKMRQYDLIAPTDSDINQLLDAGLIKKKTTEPYGGQIVEGDYTYKVKPNSTEGKFYIDEYRKKYLNMPENPDLVEADLNKALVDIGELGGEGYNGTIFQVFPELLEESNKLKNMRPTVDEVTLTVKPKPRQQASEGAYYLNPDPKGIPAIVGKTIGEYTASGLVARILEGTSKGVKTFLTPKEITELSEWLNIYGIDPRAVNQNGLDQIIGKSFPNAQADANGIPAREYVVGMFDDPRIANPQLDYNSSLYERFFVTYEPSSKSFGIRKGLQPPVEAFNVESGRNITKELSNTQKRFDDEINLLINFRKSEVYGTPEYIKITKQIIAAQNKKSKQIQKLKELLQNENTTYIPDLTNRQRHQLKNNDIVGYTDIMKQLYPDHYTGKPSKIQYDTVLNPDPDDVFGVKVGADWKRNNVVPQINKARQGEFGPGIYPDGDQATFISDAKLINDQYIEHLHDVQKYGNIYESMAATIELIAQRKGLPKPPIPHGVAAMTNKSDDSVGALDRFLQAFPEATAEDILATWEGARNLASIEIDQWWKEGVELLKEAGIGKKGKRGSWFVSRKEGEELVKILFTPNAVIPAKFEKIVKHLREMQKIEQSAYEAFNPDLKVIFDDHPDYFPMIWQAPKGSDIAVNAEGKWFTTTAGHLMPRTDETFQAKLDKGWNLVSWNPMDLMAIRRARGINHRENVLLVEKFKKSGHALTKEEAMRVNAHKALDSKGKILKDQTEYVKPNLGPAWDGYRTMDVLHNEEIAESAIYLPRKSAQMLEAMYGVDEAIWEVSVSGTKSLDIGKLVEKIASTGKRSILVGSGFQHHDLGSRGLAAGMSWTSLSRTGKKVRNPFIRNLSFMGRIIATQFYGGKYKGFGRGATLARLTSKEPIFDDFDIAFNDLVLAGLSISGDLSVIQREALEQLKDIERGISAEDLKLFPKLGDRLAQGFKWWESGLFDGVYRETQMFMAENQIIPQLRKQFPDAPKEVIARKAVDILNIQTSSLGSWQTAFKSQRSKTLARALLFSPNETEAWLYALKGTVTGDMKAIYGQYWLGYFTYLATLSNAINLMTTGKPLPLSSYSPISIKNSEDADFPLFPIQYNSRFMSPIIGHGRNGNPLYLDVVGQADTIFHYIVGGYKTIDNRTSPFINILKPVLMGETFYGEPLEGITDRVKYGVLQNMPIGAWQTVQAFREDVPFLQNNIPTGETGIGGMGRIIQIAGINIRRADTNELKSEVARILGYEKVPMTISNFFDQLINPKKYSAYSQAVIENPSQFNTVLNTALATGGMEPLTPEEQSRIQHISNEMALRTQEAANRGQKWAISKTIKEEFADQRLDDLHNVIVDIENGDLSLRDLMPTISDINTSYYSKLAATDDIFKLYEDGQERPEEKLPAARWDYYKALEESKKYGTIDWREFESKIAILEQYDWDAEQIAHIQEIILTKDYDQHYPPFLAELFKTRDKYKWYFDYTTNYLYNYDRANQTNFSDLYYDYLNSNHRPNFLTVHSKFAKVLKTITAEKKYLRELPQYDELLRTLAQLGYIDISTYQNVANKRAR